MNNEMPNDSLQKFEDICHENGLSITPQRVAIYKDLIASSEHPSAAAIFNNVREYYKNISLDTVNRTLLKFQEIGLAKVVESSGHPKSFDPNLEPHHHFRCVKCGKIYDFKDETYDNLALPESIKGKFIILDKIVHLEGICDACREDR
jgi:Fur family peroxide stress response transcriptional regulator